MRDIEEKPKQESFSWEKDVNESCPGNEHNQKQRNLSGDSDAKESGPVQEQDQEDKTLSLEFRWMSRAYRSEPAMETCSVADSSVDNNSRISEIDTYSDKFSSTGSEMSEIAFHTFLVETRARDLDREAYQDPDSDRYLVPGDRVVGNAADDLETKALSKRSLSLLPQ